MCTIRTETETNRRARPCLVLILRVCLMVIDFLFIVTCRATEVDDAICGLVSDNTLGSHSPFASNGRLFCIWRTGMCRRNRDHQSRYSCYEQLRELYVNYQTDDKHGGG